MSSLRTNTLLQGGKYRIEKVLGQGGFGITYLATQEILNRKVCIKEFFFKEYCERDTGSSHVTLGTQANHEIVERFLNKFLKEARTISQLEHRNIIKIHDIFKENNTAYYVMDYVEGESLNDMVNRRGALPENEAVSYINRVADALQYIHQKNINHLDVKPSNIMIRQDDYRVILIDFGLAKQYDTQGSQTSTTPVGISHGYAPMEQYKQGGVSTFSPQADIYALGATLYKLVTGKTPPQAMDVFSDGLPTLPSSISRPVSNAIKKAMQPRKTDRPQSIAEFLNILGEDKSYSKPSVSSSTTYSSSTERTIITTEPKTDSTPKVTLIPDAKPSYAKYIVAVLGILLAIVIIVTANSNDNGNQYYEPVMVEEEVVTEEVDVDTTAAVVAEEETEEVFPDTTAVVEKSNNTINGHDYVDLGLSVKWATCNVGANHPEDYGNYYAWGETYAKSSYTEDNSRTDKKSMEDISGNASYDAARANWGGTWRLPTKREMEELKDECTWTWITQSSINGYKVTGPNGNSIFLPAAGGYDGSSHNYVGEYGYYWGATPYWNKGGACYFIFYKGFCNVNWNYRYYGLTVRPVSD